MFPAPLNYNTNSHSALTRDGYEARGRVIETRNKQGFCPGIQGSPMAPSVSASFSGTGILLMMMKLFPELASERHDKISFVYIKNIKEQKNWEF